MTARLVAIGARSHGEGRAIAQSSMLHRRLVDRPIAVVLFQMAGEPFGATAVRYGRGPDDTGLITCPDSRNRELLFTALLPFAHWFVEAFEEANAQRVEEKGRETATGAPQIIVANGATAGAWANLARRTAFLSADGEWAADPALIMMGRHLQWATRHTQAGQQVLLALTDLLAENWATPLSGLEAQSLPALDAWIEPPAGVDGHAAAAEAEDLQMGPLASAESDRELADLVGLFHDARRQEDEEDRAAAEAMIEEHLAALVEPAWVLLWRCLHRERQLPEAPSVDGRFAVDRREYTRHMDWMAQGGRRRASETSRQAASLRARLEEARSRLEAEEAIDDLLRMVPLLVDGRAILGSVVELDTDHKEQGPKRMVSRPRVTIETDETVLLPAETELFWTDAPTMKWTVVRIDPADSGGSKVTLQRGSGTRPRAVTTPFLPMLGDSMLLSDLTTSGGPPFRLPDEDPWTHRPPTADAPASIEED